MCDMRYAITIWLSISIVIVIVIVIAIVIVIVFCVLYFAFCILCIGDSVFGYTRYLDSHLYSNFLVCFGYIWNCRDSNPVLILKPAELAGMSLENRLTSYDWQSQFDVFQRVTRNGSFRPICLDAKNNMLAVSNTHTGKFVIKMKGEQIRSIVCQSLLRHFSLLLFGCLHFLITLEWNSFET